MGALGARPAQHHQPFVRGFLTDGGITHFARPAGLAIARDGSLLMADDANGVIYRVAYTGDGGGSRVLKAPATAMLEKAAEGVLAAMFGQMLAAGAAVGTYRQLVAPLK